MDHSLLQSWLGLPPGPWPPDHYTLLGLTPGRCDPATAERVVLERMARLRPHQILHPELVTEGMNRLAQALVCLTDPVTRAAYDGEIGLVPTVAEPVPARPVPPPLPVLPYEVVPDGVLSIDSTQLVDLSQTAETRSLPAMPFEIVEETEAFRAFEVVEEPIVEAEFIAPPRPQWQPKTRRQLYARLVRVRRLLDAWRRLKPMLADSTEQLDRPQRVLAFLETISEIRPLLVSRPALMGDPWRPGGMVAAMIRQDHVLSIMRVLLADQRRALALDWQEGEMDLNQEYLRLRELARSRGLYRRRFQPRGWLVRAFQWAFRNPESLLIGLTGVVIVVAILRNIAGG